MIDSHLFRRTMRQWAAGVTVITIGRLGKVHGMTANSFTSVSCTPPLMLFCVGHSNDTHALVKIGETVGINLLSDAQIDICNRFATKTVARYKFDDLASFTGPKGATLFSGCAAVMEAVVAQAHEAGDHTIFIGEIVFAETDETKKPLVYSQGALARLHPITPEVLAKTTQKGPEATHINEPDLKAAACQSAAGNEAGTEILASRTPSAKADSSGGNAADGKSGTRRTSASAGIKKSVSRELKRTHPRRNHEARS